MSIKQYSLIPEHRNSSDLLTKFPWVANRPLLIPVGWLGLLYNTCEEIEAALTPMPAVDGVEYFFATIRDSRLQIFIQLHKDLYGQASSDVINSLINEVQTKCYRICNICGKELDVSDKYHYKNTMPNCGSHEKIETKDSEGDDNTSCKNKESEELLTLDTELTLTTESDVSKDQVTASIQLYDLAVINKLHFSASSNHRDKEDAKAVRTIMSKLIEMGGNRQLRQLPSNNDYFLDKLEADFPNFSEVINMLKGISALSTENEVPRVPPILLLGAPGLGKTLFAEALATGIDVPFRVIRMENQQASAGLVGSADFWSNTKTGAIFNVLTEGKYGNPVIVIDEVDKATQDSQYNPINSLYSLLEPSSAATFKDESLPDITINASKIIWILTANYKQQIPEPILSRVRTFEIPNPNKEQSTQIVKRIYQLLLNDSSSLKNRFSNELSEDVILFLSKFSPRKVRLSIECGLGKAAIAKRSKLIIDDFDVPKESKEAKIGFL